MQQKLVHRSLERFHPSFFIVQTSAYISDARLDLLSVDDTSLTQRDGWFILHTILLSCSLLEGLLLYLLLSNTSKVFCWIQVRGQSGLGHWLHFSPLPSQTLFDFCNVFGIIVM